MKKKIVIASFFSFLAASASFAVTPISSLSGVTPVPADGTYNIDTDLHLKSAANGGDTDSTYILDSFTFVTNGATLTIDPGVIIRGQPADLANNLKPGGLIVTREGQINAKGTSTAPIIFTTAANAANRGRWTSGAFLDSDPVNDPLPPVSYDQWPNPTDGVDNANLWSAVTVLGYAPINTNESVTGVAGEDIIEGFNLGTDDRLKYGGSNPHHSSGILEYVSIRYTGETASIDQEQQGLTLGGVGNGTQINYLDIFVSGDDGIEIFGGTVNITNFVISYADDDALDIDQGYTGALQFGLVVASDLPAVGGATGLHTDNLAEWDGDDDISADGFNVSETGAPFTYPAIYNVTFVGPQSGTGSLTKVIRARQGFGGDIRNSIVAAFPNATAFQIDNTGTSHATDYFYPSVKSGDRVVLGTHTYAGTLWYNGTATTVVQVAADNWSGAVLSNGAAYNSVTAKDSFLNRIGVNPGLDDLDQTWGGFGFIPVPSNTAAVTGANVAIDGVSTPASILPVNYIGAFEPVSGTLWTTGWTALNKGGVLVD